jgi:DNA polymerase III epsilon subunit-like protein
MALIIDIETTGLPIRDGLPYGKYHPYENIEMYNTSRIVQLSMMLCNDKYEEIDLKDFIVKANDFTIDNHEFHGITNEISLNSGRPFIEIMEEFLIYIKQVSCIIAHNANFDINILFSELYRNGLHSIIMELKTKKIICTMKNTKQIVKAKNKYGIKDPSLAELYKFVIKENIENAHNSKYDVINLHKVIKSLYDTNLF